MITDPRDIPGLVFWYDAALEPLVDNAPLAKLTDQSGNNRHAFCSADPSANKWRATGGPSGGPVYDFAGIPWDWYQLDLSQLSANGGEIMATLKPGSGGGHWSLGEGANGNTAFFDTQDAPVPHSAVYREDFGTPYVGNGSYYHLMTPVAAGDTGWHNVSAAAIIAAGSPQFRFSARFDGRLLSQELFNDYPSFPNPTLGYGASPDGDFRMFDGLFERIVLYKRELTAVERADLYAWMGIPTGPSPVGDSRDTAFAITGPSYQSSPTSSLRNSIEPEVLAWAGNVTQRLDRTMWWKYVNPGATTVTLTLDGINTVLGSYFDSWVRQYAFLGDSYIPVAEGRIGDGALTVTVPPGQTCWAMMGRQVKSTEDVQYVMSATVAGESAGAPSKTVDSVAFGGSGTLSLTAGTQAPVVERTVAEVSFAGSSSLSMDVEFSVPKELTIQILDDVVEQAPTPITVVLVEGYPETDVEFRIDGTLVHTVTTDTDGYLSPTSINIPENLGAAGEHVLTAIQPGTYSATGSATFTIRFNPAVTPTVMGPDAQAVDVPGAIRPNGTRRWVLQDLLPGGLGSWIMPKNPREGTTPYSERALSVKTTTAGRHHVSEGAAVPLEWTFSGIALDEEFAEKLLAYWALNRRIYVINHRGQAFKVYITDVELTPRLRKIFGDDDAYVEAEYIDGHDYSVTCTVLDQQWVVPA